MSKSARITIEYNICANFSVFKLGWLDFISGWWGFDIQFIFRIKFLSIAGSAHANVSSGITWLSICDNQLNTLLLQNESKMLHKTEAMIDVCIHLHEYCWEAVGHLLSSILLDCPAMMIYNRHQLNHPDARMNVPVLISELVPMDQILDEMLQYLLNTEKLYFYIIETSRAMQVLIRMLELNEISFLQLHFN